MSWALAARNLRRDRRRSVVTVLSVLVGIAAILLFLAYIQFIESALSRLVIYQDGNAHVQIYRKGGPENLSAFPARYSLGADDQKRIEEASRRAAPSAPSGIVRTTIQLMGVGMIQNGAESVPFLARGVDPLADAALRADGGFADAAEDVLPAGQGNGVLLTRQIAELLALPAERTGLAAAGSLQLSAATYRNRFNAVDVVPAGFFTTGIEPIESKSIKLPLRALQALYDTDDASRAVVQLRDRADTDAFAAALQVELDRSHAGRYVVTTWRSPQVGQLYLSFMSFADTMFFFTGTILLLIAVTTMQHTISGNVTDRLKEIGMLRAMGFSRGAVQGMFVRESALLAACAAVLALLFCYAVCAASGALGLQTALPRLAVPVPVALGLAPALALSVALFAVASLTLAAWWTARRVVRGSTARPGPFSLARLVAGSAACLALALAAPRQARADAAGAVPDEATMKSWLVRADISRGGFVGYSWTARVHSEEPAGNSDTTYRVAVSDGRALVRTVEPPRYAGEKILLDGRAMWYGKKDLRRPVSISPQQRLSGEAANGDIASVHYSRDYTPVYLGEESVDGRDCHKLKLVATGAQVTYDAIQYYIDKRSLLGVKADFMTAGGTVFKTARVEYRNKVTYQGAETPFVSSMKIVNAAFPERFSVIEYVDVRTARHPESLFRLDNLLTP